MNKTVSFVIDRDALIDDRIIPILNFIQNIRLNIFVSDFVIKEFERMIETGQLDEWEIGNKAIENMRKLQEVEFFNVQIIADESEGDLNDKIIAIVKKNNCTLLTGNFDLYIKANIENLKIVNIKYVEEICQKTFLPGHVLKAFISESENNQGIAYFADGTKILIDEAAENLKNYIFCKVYKVSKNMNNKIIFAKFLHRDE
ncbi:MAG: hypothetical protein GY830_09330 [Bacteroidetes bacterium]|nr:hypothetical protein [Bacteroidota bacterium]